MLLQQKLIYPLACSTFSLWEMGCMGKQSIPEATAHIIGSITRSDEGMWSLPTSLMDFYSACHFLSGVLSKYVALREVFLVWARQHSAQDQKEIIDVYSRAPDFRTRTFVHTTTHIYFVKCGCSLHSAITWTSRRFTWPSTFPWVVGVGVKASSS